MEAADERKIISSTKELIPRLDMVKLFPKLLEHGIYMKEDKNIPKWKGTLTEPGTVRDIYLTITKRGPRAFQNLLASLRETQQGDLADILIGGGSKLLTIGCVTNRTNGETSNVNETGSNGHQETSQNGCFIGGSEGTSMSDTVPINDSYWSHIQTATNPLKIDLKMSKRFCDTPVQAEKLNFYPMRNKLRGLVLIINNMEFTAHLTRVGSEHDVANLDELFKKMGFEVTIHKNQSEKDLRKKIEIFSKKEELYRADSCFVIIMSHGDQTDLKDETVIYGTDEVSLSSGEIMDYFSGEKCKNMNGKPKVFIFQCCRGLKKQATVDRNATDGCIPQTAEATVDSQSLSSQNTRKYSDTLLVFSTLPGYVANRDVAIGSWYIQILCEVLMNHAHDTHLLELLCMADERLAKQRTMENKCQTSSFVNMGFNKYCYLNPGL